VLIEVLFADCRLNDLQTSLKIAVKQRAEFDAIKTKLEVGCILAPSPSSPSIVYDIK